MKKKRKESRNVDFRLTHSTPALPWATHVILRLYMMPGRAGRRPRAAARSPPAAYPLTHISSSPDTPTSPLDPDRDGLEMSRLSNNGGRLTSVNPSTRHSRLRVPYLPQPSDVAANPDSPVSEQAAELIHEFIHPHHHHHSRENLTEEEPDDAGDDAPTIARELEEMQSRVWWRRPSALWYALNTLASS